ncbi:hypothetical protein M2444_001795 [Paenibacillus sp. PastF-3]|nr:hypothetical protein [Paenibacillus sp. PastF-3]OZQ76736.1 hypothetical protein CA598_30275 [Paenibacillus sp. VTT E-133291]
MDNQNLTNVLALASVITVFVLAGIQFVKVSVNVPKNMLPLIGFVIGLLIGIVAYPFTDLDITLRLWSGALAGLSATGLFELAYNRVKLLPTGFGWWVFFCFLRNAGFRNRLTVFVSSLPKRRYKSRIS